MQKIKDIKFGKNGSKLSTKERFLSRFLWLLSTSRNAVIVILCSTVAYFYESSGYGSPVILTGTVKPGLPEFKPPPFSTELYNQTITFPEMLTDLGSSVFLVPVIAVLGNVAIAKAFGKFNKIFYKKFNFEIS